MRMSSIALTAREVAIDTYRENVVYLHPRLLRWASMITITRLTHTGRAVTCTA